MVHNEDGWQIYQGKGEPHDGIERLPAPPPWRDFRAESTTEDRRLGVKQRAESYRADERTVWMVNIALLLRRPLLVTGNPGTGKSTLAYSIAHELRLGQVLYWSITSRVTLKDGLYNYDAVGRLQESSLIQASPLGGMASPVDIGRYIRLGPLGTALLPSDRPRVLLIDELDKSDIDLPNDLLNIFEEGAFAIPELKRQPDEHATVEVMTWDGGERVPIVRGEVQCPEFPIVIITSNGEREFPPAFLRRCIRLPIEPPNAKLLEDIVIAHLGEQARTAGEQEIQKFLTRRTQSDMATDQLLNAIFLVTSGSMAPETTLKELAEAVLRPLDASGSE